MQVNVLITDAAGAARTPLLVIPFGTDAAIPDHLKGMHWRELATATTDDRLLRTRCPRIEAEIACRGYSMLLT